MKQPGMYEVDPLQAIFSTISMGFAEAVKKGTITEEQEATLIARLNELMMAVLSGRVLVWTNSQLQIMGHEEAIALAKAKGVPTYDAYGDEVDFGQANKAVASPNKTIRIGGKK